MRRILLSASLACAALFSAGTAFAQGPAWSVTVGSGGFGGVAIGMPAPIYAPPVMYAPPVSYAPRPVYAPAVVYPPRVVYAPPPQVVYAPQPYYDGWRGQRHGHRHHHDHWR